MKINKSILHIAFWCLAFVVWVFIFKNRTLALTQAATIQFCYLIFIAANYYFNTNYSVPYLLDRKKYIWFGLTVISGIVFTALLRVPVSILVSRYIFKIENTSHNYLIIFYGSLINIFFWTALILTGRLTFEKIRLARYLEQIEKEKATTELTFLRGQFNPHFLFNSINSIYGHIDKYNKEARYMLLVFSEMLRYQLYECNADQITLDREVNYIRNYIAMQKTRIDERITVSFIADNVIGNIKVEPLLLITFIENAFKFVGFKEHKENGICIELISESRQLIFKAWNTKDNSINLSEKSSGLGIANAKRRLELLYPDKHELQIQDRENDYDVTLVLNVV